MIMRRRADRRLADIRWGLVPLGAMLLACADPAPPLDRSTVAVATPLRATTGVMLTIHEQTKWQSQVDSGRITSIRQQFAGRGGRLGWRVYHYDEQGQLRHFSEGAYNASDSLAMRDALTMQDSGLTVESLASLAEPVRQQLMVVHFLADLPVLSMGRRKRQSLEISRPYLATIVRHSAELFVRATREGTTDSSTMTAVPASSPALPVPK